MWPRRCFKAWPGIFLDVTFRDSKKSWDPCHVLHRDHSPGHRAHGTHEFPTSPCSLHRRPRKVTRDAFSRPPTPLNRGRGHGPSQPENVRWFSQLASVRSENLPTIWAASGLPHPRRPCSHPGRWDGSSGGVFREAPSVGGREGTSGSPVGRGGSERGRVAREPRAWKTIRARKMLAWSATAPQDFLCGSWLLGRLCWRARRMSELGCLWARLFCCCLLGPSSP